MRCRKRVPTKHRMSPRDVLRNAKTEIKILAPFPGDERLREHCPVVLGSVDHGSWFRSLRRAKGLVSLNACLGTYPET